MDRVKGKVSCTRCSEIMRNVVVSEFSGRAIRLYHGFMGKLISHARSARGGSHSQCAWVLLVEMDDVLKALVLGLDLAFSWRVTGLEFTWALWDL